MTSPYPPSYNSTYAYPYGNRDLGWLRYRPIFLDGRSSKSSNPTLYNSRTSYNGRSSKSSNSALYNSRSPKFYNSTLYNSRSSYNGVQDPYFIPGTSLDPLQRKYCRCLMHYRAKQPDWCITEGHPYEVRNGERCYGWYAGCKASTKQFANIECSEYYNFENIPDRELIAYAKEKRVPIPTPYNREKLIDSLYDYVNKRV